MRPAEIEDAAGRLARALERGEQIVVFADRDVDGVCGCAILVELCRRQGANVGWYVPGKWDGYGLSEATVEDIAARDADLLVTVDTGTTASEEISAATSLDIDVVVTDHHQPEEALPDATACVNPRRDDSNYPHDGLAGGGVALKLGRALVESRTSLDLDSYYGFALPLAALSTVGDYVPLNLENRAIVWEGYGRLEDCGLPGLSETATHCDVSSIEDLSWSLVPLLNAAQEDESGDLPLKLLFARDRDQREAFVSLFEDYREQRRRERAAQRDHLEECFDEQIDPGTDEDLVYLVETDGYVSGGVVTGLSKQVGRPVITYREKDGFYQGGGRSDPDVNFLDLYGECDDYLEEYWGHPGAAGFRVSETAIESFVRSVRDAVRERYSPDDLRPTVEIDVVLEPTQVTEALVDQFERLRPFGPENEEPCVLLEGIAVDHCETFGSDDDHVRIETGNEHVTLVYWNGAGDTDVFEGPPRVDVVGTLEWDAYADEPRVSVSDYRVP